ncbi:phosphotriesterase [Streptomyces sp. ODS28]|uniref:phosphotriesterase family protein n=1 Tax=Streptomyces sp. ODS28 TaxID=3136688 RepID=UPI0031EE28EB
MTAAVRTVLGDIPGPDLGLCDAHNHLFLSSPRLPGQELDGFEDAEAGLRSFAGAGGGTVVQWTPYGMGRRSGALVELSRRTGVHLVAATGLHQARHYAEGSAWDVDGLAELFTGELTRGVRGAACGEAPRAGLIKVADGPQGLDAHARRTHRAAARAHHATGAPIAVHLERGTGGTDVLALLCGELDVPPHRVLLGHLGRCPDPRTQREAARSGAWLAFDGPSAPRLLDSLAALAEAGHGDRLLVGGDLTTYEAHREHGLRHLPGALRTHLERRLGAKAADQILRRNPSAAFAADWRP